MQEVAYKKFNWMKILAIVLFGLSFIYNAWYFFVYFIPESIHGIYRLIYFGINLISLALFIIALIKKSELFFIIASIVKIIYIYFLVFEPINFYFNAIEAFLGKIITAIIYSFAYVVVIIAMIKRMRNKTSYFKKVFLFFFLPIAVLTEVFLLYNYYFDILLPMMNYVSSTLLFDLFLRFTFELAFIITSLYTSFIFKNSVPQEVANINDESSREDAANAEE